MPRNKDVLWEHIIQEGRKVRCKFCQEVFVGGVTRMRYHFAKTKSKDIRPCQAVPDSVRDIALRGVQELESKSKRHKVSIVQKSTASSLGSIFQTGELQIEGPKAYDPSQKPICCRTQKSRKKEADLDIVKFIVSNNLSFSLLKSKEFQEACTAVANAGPGYEPPSSEAAWTRLSGQMKDEADMYVNSVKRTWEKSGCTLILDSCMDRRESIYLNLLAACPKGVVYLKSLCTDGYAVDGCTVIEFVSSVIEEIGSRNVVQFVSDNTPVCTSVGHMIEQKYPNVFKINSAAHLINLMFEEFYALEKVAPILDGAKKIVNFVNKNQHLLNSTWNHIGSDGLKKPVSTRFISNFICLWSVIKDELALRQMVATSEWRNFTQCRTSEWVEAQNIILDNVFWDSGKELIRAIEPLVKVLRMINDNGSTSGYIYEAMQKVKEAMKVNFGGDVNKYMPFLRIIDDKWHKLLHCDIHAAAAYLNPHLFHDGRVKLDSVVKVGLENVIQKMVVDSDERIKIAEELRDYHLLDPQIFGRMAVDSLHVSHPRIWWDMWGSSVPILQSLAIKILSQPCSSPARVKSSSAIDATNNSKREKENPMKLQDLLYVRMNKQLMKTIGKPESIDSKPIDIDKIEAFPVELEGFDFHDDSENSDGEEEQDEQEEQEESEDEVGSLAPNQMQIGILSRESFN